MMEGKRALRRAHKERVERNRLNFMKMLGRTVRVQGEDGRRESIPVAEASKRDQITAFREYGGKEYDYLDVHSERRKGGGIVTNTPLENERELRAFLESQNLETEAEKPSRPIPIKHVEPSGYVDETYTVRPTEVVNVRSGARPLRSLYSKREAKRFANL